MLRLTRTGQLCTHTGMRLQPRVALRAPTIRSCKVCVPLACAARCLPRNGGMHAPQRVLTAQDACNARVSRRYAAREPLGRLRSPGARALRRVQAPVQGAHAVANASLHVAAALPPHCFGCACRGGRPTTGTSGTAPLPARCRLSRCAAQVAIDRTCACPSRPVRAHSRVYRAAQLSTCPETEGQCSSLGRGQNSSPKVALESPWGAWDGCAAVCQRCGGWGRRLRRSGFSRQLNTRCRACWWRHRACSVGCVHCGSRYAATPSSAPIRGHTARPPLSPLAGAASRWGQTEGDGRWIAHTATPASMSRAACAAGQRRRRPDGWQHAPRRRRRVRLRASTLHTRRGRRQHHGQQARHAGPGMRARRCPGAAAARNTPVPVAPRVTPAARRRGAPGSRVQPHA
jgi:hypothetical protein